ncbi:hypothetical protein [Niveispirillum sp. KHB5.9]|uniref:hypothetical protein n=1 Tax=Niveispirillum sp. KHB5.9 TaxID=3400269 RepID=UPI003A8947DC
MRLLRLLLPLLCLLALPAMAQDRPPARCQSPEETETVAALAREGIAEPKLALKGAGRSAAAQGGEWLVVAWRPCLDPAAEPEAGVPTRVTLYHRADRAKPKQVAAIDLPAVQLYVSPVDDPVVETPWGPLLLVEASTGGSCMGCEKLVPLLLSDGRLLSVEPADARVALREVTSSAPDIIVTGYLSTFEGYRPLCNACSPSTTLHLRLEKDRLVEACDRFRDDYANDALAAGEELAMLAADPPGPETATDLFSGAIARLLDRLNTGEGAGAVLPDLLSVADKAGTMADARLAGDIGRAARALAAEVEAAAKAGRLNRACPALGVNRPAG